MSPKKGLSALPSVVQLPGGIQLKPMPFKITGYDEAGMPKAFELLPVAEMNAADFFFFASWDQLGLKRKA